MVRHIPYAIAASAVYADAASVCHASCTSDAFDAAGHAASATTSATASAVDADAASVCDVSYTSDAFALRAQWPEAYEWHYASICLISGGPLAVVPPTTIRVVVVVVPGCCFCCCCCCCCCCFGCHVCL